MRRLLFLILTLFCALPLAAQVTLFEADFDGDANGINEAIGGSRDVEWTRRKPVERRRYWRNRGNAAGGASTDNALLPDTGEDDDGSKGINLTATSTLLQGNFSEAAMIGGGSSFLFSFDFYHTRVVGNADNNQRNVQLSLNANDSRVLVITFELHDTGADLVVRDGDDDFDTPTASIVLDGVTRPTLSAGMLSKLASLAMARR